jgi:hypothetical protein
VLIFDGQTDQLITAVLRPGRCHESRFVVLILRRLVKRLRAAWPHVTIELRADSGFAVPRLYAWCEANGLTYTIGMIPNRRGDVVGFMDWLLGNSKLISQTPPGLTYASDVVQHLLGRIRVIANAGLSVLTV